MFRRILPPILVALALLVDTAVIPVFSSHWLMPLFALITVHCMGLLLGRTRGLLFGMIAGLLADIAVSTPLGLMTLFYALMGYAGGWVGRQRFRTRFLPVISAAVCFTVFELAMAGYVTLASAAFNRLTFVHAFARIAVDVVLTEGFYLLYAWMIRPSRSRFAQR